MSHRHLLLPPVTRSALTKMNDEMFDLGFVILRFVMIEILVMQSRTTLCACTITFHLYESCRMQSRLDS
jgi:hypothetical protein